MKMKIFLFVAVAFVASSEASPTIPDNIRGLLNEDTVVPTAASDGGVSGFSTGLDDAEDQIRRVDKGKGDSLTDTLKKLSNKTYSPPEGFKDCLKEKNEETKKNLTDLTKKAKNVSDEIKEKCNDDTLTEPLKNYTDAFTEWQKLLSNRIASVRIEMDPYGCTLVQKASRTILSITEVTIKLNTTFWFPLENGDFENALKELEKTENCTKNAKTKVMTTLWSLNNTGLESAMTKFNDVNEKWKEIKISVNSTIIYCL